jgi:hypothetical protein
MAFQESRIDPLIFDFEVGMSAGKKKPLAHRASGLRFAVNRLIILFRDGRKLHLPLQLYPTLLDATPQQRKAWQMIGPGKAFYWKELDLDLSVDGLIQGLREVIPPPPKTTARRSA